MQVSHRPLHWMSEQVKQLLFNIRFTWLTLKKTALAPGVSLFPDLT